MRKLLARIFGSKPKSETTVTLKMSSESRAAWWGIFHNALSMAVDDTDDLARMSDPAVARRVVEGARNLADAALDAYEDRFPT